MADQLELSEEQRASTARLLNERAQAISEAAVDQRAAIEKASDDQIAALLNDVQRARLATLTAPQELRFNFRFQKWVDVLDWFAQQADLTLVMDQPPPGTFTFSDAKSYTPTQAIDLLNSVLLTKGFALIRRDRLLVLVNLSGELPMDLIPKVDVEQLPERGSFEFVTVLFPLEGRPADAVSKEIQPLLGNHGACLALPANRPAPGHRDRRQDAGHQHLDRFDSHAEETGETQGPSAQTATWSDGVSCQVHRCGKSGGNAEVTCFPTRSSRST